MSAEMTDREYMAALNRDLLRERTLHEEADAQNEFLRDEIGHLRAGISHARGMCSDEEPHDRIDAHLGRVLAAFGN